MARMDKCCVNLSGASHPVYDEYGNTIGAIEPREFFTYVGAEGSLLSIYFLSPSGARYGYLHEPVPQSVLTEISTRPYGTAVIDNTTYKTFIMRSQQNLYDAYGNCVGSVAAGKRVACLTGMSGSNQPYLKGINYAEKRAGGWDSMRTNEDINYGFVDTGLRTSSSASGIALYGNW